MLNSRLVTAAVLSLGFHAVVITAVGFSVGSVPESPPVPSGHSSTLVRLNTVSAQRPEALPEIPSPPPTPAAASAADSIPDAVSPPAENPSADPVADPAAQPREQPADIPVEKPGGSETDSAELNSGRAGEFTETVPSARTGITENADPLLVTTIDPVYPVLARRLGVQGVVVLDVVIDPGGVPIECIVVSPRAHKILEDSALAAVMQARFKPGMQGGRPIQDTYRLTVRFELEA